MHHLTMLLFTKVVKDDEIKCEQIWEKGPLHTEAEFSTIKKKKRFITRD